MSAEGYMQAAAELAAIAGANAMRFYRGPLSVEAKADGTPVTIADRSTEEIARQWIQARFPADGILGEEFGSIRPEAQRQWIIDPIDGTKSFVRGVPLWGTLVAVAEGISVLAGAAVFPAVSETLSAGIGEGCWWNGSRCAVSQVKDLSRATVLTSDLDFSTDPTRRAPWDRLSRAAGISRTWGDCFGYLLVATGRAEVMIDPVVSRWDVAAFLPAVVEAGGMFTDWSGEQSAFNSSAVATNAALAREARDILRGSSDVEE
jgi:histidinol-phosphatase